MDRVYGGTQNIWIRYNISGLNHEYTLYITFLNPQLMWLTTRGSPGRLIHPARAKVNKGPAIQEPRKFEVLPMQGNAAALDPCTTLAFFPNAAMPNHLTNQPNDAAAAFEQGHTLSPDIEIQARAISYKSN